MQTVDLAIMWQKFYGILNDIIQRLPLVFFALIVFIFFYIAGKILRSVIKKTMRRHKHYNIGLVLARMMQWLLVLIGGLITLAIIFPSITSADVLAGLGVGSIALSLAFKDILQNYLAGILILLREPFKIGDEIIYKNFEGVVEFIDTRTTFLRSYDGRKILIPNGEIYTNSIIVNTAYEYRCTEYNIGIGSSDDLEKASEILVDVLSNIKDILKNPKPEVLVIDLDQYTNNLCVRWWTTPYHLETLRIKNQVLKQIKKRFYEQGIDIPFPTQVVLWHDQTEETDGDRNKQREGWPPRQQHTPKANTLANAIAKAS